MSTDSMFHWRHLGSVLRSDCRQRHRQCLESGPRFSLQCWWWCGHQCGDVLPFQWRERSHVNTSACSSGSTFHEHGCHIRQRQTGEVHCQHSNTQIQILIGLQVRVRHAGALVHFSPLHNVTRVFLGKATPHSAGDRHGWFVSCVGPTAHHARSIYRLLCVHHHVARDIKAVVVFRCWRTGGW